MKNKELIISPKTKVLNLLEVYPQLEEVLISYIPAFKKLQNPILRKTVAKIATLQQAAAIGGVKVENLINHLRKEVGQDKIETESKSPYNTVKPDWFVTGKIKSEDDVRAMLAAGEHPVNQVIADLQKLEKGEIHKITTPFLPAPLIEKTISLNYEHWIDKKAEDIYDIYFKK